MTFKFWQNEARDRNFKVFVGEVFVQLSLIGDNDDDDDGDGGDGGYGDEEKDEHKGGNGAGAVRRDEDDNFLGRIDGYLYLPTLKWDKTNDFIFTRISLTPQHIDARFGFKFNWKLKRLYGFKYDMRDAKLELNIFANGSRLSYPFDDEINCNISWQTIYIHDHDNDEHEQNHANQIA